MNRKGLELVTSIMADIKAAHPKIGKETVAFDNVESDAGREIYWAPGAG